MPKTVVTVKTDKLISKTARPRRPGTPRLSILPSQSTTSLSRRSSKESRWPAQNSKVCRLTRKHRTSCATLVLSSTFMRTTALRFAWLTCSSRWERFKTKSLSCSYFNEQTKRSGLFGWLLVTSHPLSNSKPNFSHSSASRKPLQISKKSSNSTLRTVGLSANSSRLSQASTL